MRWAAIVFAAVLIAFVIHAPLQAQLLTTGAGAGPVSSSSPTPVPSPTVTQSAGCSGVTSCALGASPTTGHTIAVVLTGGDASMGSVSVKDSAGNVLTQDIVSTNCATNGHCAAEFHEVAPASITGTFSFLLSGSGYSAHASAIYDIANATTGSYTQNNSASSGTTMVATLSGVTANSIQICGGIFPTGSANLTTTYSTGTAAYAVQNTIDVISDATAASTASSTCTAGNLTSGSVVGMVYADYP